MAQALAKALARPVLLRMAGAAGVQRGRELLASGAISNFKAKASQATASVLEAADRFTPQLTIDEGLLDYACTCPSNGRMCAHAAAVALLWSERLAGKGAGRAKRPGKATFEDAREALLELTPEEMVGEIMQWAARIEPLREELILFTARRQGKTVDAKEIGKRLRNLLPRAYVRGRERTRLLSQLPAELDQLERILNEGLADAALELSRILILGLSRQEPLEEEPRGWMKRAEAVHLRAAVAAKPDPEKLAASLLEGELHHGVFPGAAKTYAPVLGAAGTREYGGLLRQAAMDGQLRYGWHERLRAMAASVGEVTGDWTVALEFSRKRLNDVNDLQWMVKVHRSAGQLPGALEVLASLKVGAWLRQPLDQLRFEVEIELGRTPTIWEQSLKEFARSPDFALYQAIRRMAGKMDNWPETLRTLRRAALPLDLEVGILLHDDQVIEAWRVFEASNRNDLRVAVTVAFALLSVDFESALGLYQRAAKLLFAQGHQQEALHYLRDAESKAHELRQGPRFRQWLRTLRASFAAQLHVQKVLTGAFRLEKDE
jgi:uncharacterized Zn finger protein